ncbi:MAG TPA: hypothetical protein TECP_00375 [Hyphomicrobiaceae bacterium MAG_BT-2024]
MIGSGSTPVSAIRPAKTETIACAPGTIASATISTCFGVKTAVIFRIMPSLDKALITSPANTPLVLVTGTLTFTFEPQLEILRA